MVPVQCCVVHPGFADARPRGLDQEIGGSQIILGEGLIRLNQVI